MDSILKYTGLITISIIALIIAYKVVTTAIWLFFSGMLILLTYPLWSIIGLTILSGISLTYCLMTEK